MKRSMLLTEVELLSTTPRELLCPHNLFISRFLATGTIYSIGIVPCKVSRILRFIPSLPFLRSFNAGPDDGHPPPPFVADHTDSILYQEDRSALLKVRELLSECILHNLAVSL